MKKIAVIAIAVVLSVGGMLMSLQTSPEVNLQAHGGYHQNGGGSYCG